MVNSFSLHSGLKINFEKTEVSFLGNGQNSTTETVISLARNRNITVKKAIEMLRVHFTYDQTLWKKLNFNETLKTIRERLTISKFKNEKNNKFRRNSFRGASNAPLDYYQRLTLESWFTNYVHPDDQTQPIVKEVNKIIFNFIWKGRDKVKRLALISDVERGGLRAPHLE